eukprot:SAG22_NODE_12784_length_431_cov_1.036364_1_plen_82_part_10
MPTAARCCRCRWAARRLGVRRPVAGGGLVLLLLLLLLLLYIYCYYRDELQLLAGSSPPPLLQPLVRLPGDSLLQPTSGAGRL